MTLVDAIRQRLEVVRVKEEWTLAQVDLWRGLTGGLSLVLGLTIFEAIFRWSSTVRTGFVVLILCAVLVVVVRILLPLLRSWSILPGTALLRVAQRTGSSFPSIRDRLANALQMGSQPVDAPWVSSELAEEAIQRLHDDIASVDLTSAIDRTSLRTWRRASAMVAGLSVCASLIAPMTMSGAFERIVQFRREFTPPPLFLFEVTPGSTEAVKGARVDIRVRVNDGSGTQIQRTLDVELHHRVAGQGSFDRIGLHRDSSGSYRASLADVRVATEYYASISDAESERYMITVLDRPVLQSLRVRLEPPSYTRLPVRVQDEFLGDIRALPGTRVTVSGEANKPLAEGFVRFGDSTTVALSVRDRAFSASFIAGTQRTYRIDVTDQGSLANAAPVHYPITLLADAFPSVRVLEPGRNIDIAGNEPVPLFIEAADDYGVRRVQVGYRLSHSKFEEVRDEYTYRPITLAGGDRREVQVVDRWDLDALDLVPEDVVEYFVEVFDNDAVSGPKSVRSPLYTLRLPSLEEVFTDLDQGHEQSLEELGSALEDAKKLREDLEKISQDLKQNKETDWQKEQQAKEMSKKVEDIRKKVDEAARRMDEMTSQMQQQQVLSPETMEKYMELQGLFQNMDTQQLQKALQQMQQAMQQVNPEQLRQALEQVQFSEERFRQNIERTINLLKRIQVEQKMDEVTKRATELAEDQKELAKAADSAGTRPEELAKRQEELSADEQRLQQEASDLQQRMEEFFTEMPAEKLAELNKQLADQRLDQAMQQAAQQMRQGDMRSAQQTQSKAQQALQQFAQQMSALQQEMLQNQAAQTMNALRRATTDLLEISRDQETLRNEARTAPANSPQLRQNAQGQLRAAQDLTNVISNLGELAQRSFAVTPAMGKALGDALSKMQSAMRDLEGRNGAMASQDQTGAMAALNGAAQEVQQALQTMMEGSEGMPGGMGLMQQLQLMAGQQRSLNLQTQQMGGMDAMQRAAEAARLSREQEAIRKSLEQLDRESRSGDGTERALGDLRQIAEDMQEVVRQLQQDGADPETIRRQERILSRLLDASRSMQERDFERRRRATTGRTIERESPGGATQEAARSRLRDDLLRALEQGYTRDYQELIRKYFEELERAGSTMR